MKITHLGHACVLVDIDGIRLLLDPGSLSTPEQANGGIDAMLFTHSHIDHLDPPTVHQLLASSAPMPLIADSASGRILSEAGIPDVQVVESTTGAKLDVAGVGVEATTVAHATIHCDLPHLSNNAYFIANYLLHPGDAFWAPLRHVEVLLLPIGGPWMKLAEAVDYLRTVQPRIAIPIHQGGLAPAHRGLHCDLLRKLGPSQTELLVLEQGVSTTA